MRDAQHEVRICVFGASLQERLTVGHRALPVRDRSPELAAHAQGAGLLQGERELFKGKLARSWRTLLDDFEKDGWDSVRAAPARLEVDLR